MHILIFRSLRNVKHMRITEANVRAWATCGWTSRTLKIWFLLRDILHKLKWNLTLVYIFNIISNYKKFYNFSLDQKKTWITQALEVLLSTVFKPQYLQSRVSNPSIRKIAKNY